MSSLEKFGALERRAEGPFRTLEKRSERAFLTAAFEEFERIKHFLHKKCAVELDVCPTHSKKVGPPLLLWQGTLFPSTRHVPRAAWYAPRGTRSRVRLPGSFSI